MFDFYSEIDILKEKGLDVQYNFEWDVTKALQNYRKHKVSFERAAEIFLDPFMLSIR